MNQYQGANTNSSQTLTAVSARHHTRAHTHKCSSILYVRTHATCTTKYLHTDTGSLINTLTQTLGFFVGTPVSQRASIVVHLAVLCSTLCSQHAHHLKPDTHRSASCMGDTPLLLWTHCRCWRHSTWHILCKKSLLCSIYFIARLRLCTLFSIDGHIFWTLSWTARNCLL